MNVQTSDDHRRTPLHAAAHCDEEDGKCPNKLQIMKMMFLNRGNIQVNKIDSWGWTPLARAAKSGFEDAVRLLLNREDIDVNLGKGDKNPLYVALENKHYTIAALLKQAGARTNRRLRY